jgi:hypothetical protein
MHDILYINFITFLKCSLTVPIELSEIFFSGYLKSYV